MIRTVFLLLAVLLAGPVQAAAAPLADTVSLLWLRDGVPTAAARAALAELAQAATRGLRAEDYAALPLQQRADALAALRSDPAAQATFDRDLSQAVVRFVNHLQRGRVRPQDAGYALPLAREVVDPAPVLRALAASPAVGTTLDALEPRYRHYALLKQALARYRVLATLPAFTDLPPLPRRSVKPGEAYGGAEALRRELLTLGDLSESEALHSQAPQLDEILAAAVSRFQLRHGLAGDGVLGASTWRALVTPMAVRVRQIELAMERVRWLPPPTGGPFILVNIPQFRLFAFRGPDDAEQAMTRMNVIVGRTFPQHNTPVFMADLRYVVFRPYWDVPASIMRKEVLPLLRKNLVKGEKEGFELVRGQSNNSPVVPLDEAGLDALERGELRVRQRSGKANALGYVKFMLPNAYNVYLHSTPAQRLFGQAQRTFSHGCVRVEDPVALARFVFEGEGGWSPERIIEAMQAEGPPERIDLRTPIRVMMFYATAVAAEDGRVLFFQDIYRHDGRLEKLLARPVG